MPKVQFIQPWIVRQGDGKGPVYNVGDVVDLEASYAQKYKNRGLAVDYVKPAAAAEPAKPTEPTDPAPVDRKAHRSGRS